MARRRLTIATPARYDGCARAARRFQRENFAVARRRGGGVPRARSTLRAVRAAARVGRAPRAAWRSSAREPLTIIDGAHNPAGARALAAALGDVVGGPPHGRR